METEKIRGNLGNLPNINRLLLIYCILVILLSSIGIENEVLTFFAYYGFISFMVTRVTFLKKRKKIDRFMKTIILAAVVKIIHNHFLFAYEPMSYSAAMLYAGLSVGMSEAEEFSRKHIKFKIISSTIFRYIIGPAILLSFIVTPMVVKPYITEPIDTVNTVQVHRYDGYEIRDNDSQYIVDYLWAPDFKIKEPEQLDFLVELANDSRKSSLSWWEYYLIVTKRWTSDDEFHYLQLKNHEKLADVEIHYVNGAILGVVNEDEYFRIYTTRSNTLKLESIIFDKQKR